MNNVLEWLESIVTFFFLIGTLFVSYAPDRSLPTGLSRLFPATLLFALIFKPLETLNPSYLLYLCMTFLGVLLFNWFCLRSTFLLSSIMGLWMFHSAISAKSFLAALLLPTPEDSSTAGVAMRLLLFLLLILYFIYFRSHVIQLPPQIPISYWFVLLLLPATLISAIEWFTVSYPFAHLSNSYIPLLGLNLALFFAHYLYCSLVQIYDQRAQTAFLNQKLEFQLDSVKQSSVVMDQVRKERHELKNNYFYIHSLLRSGSYDRLERFLSDEIGPRLAITEEFCTGNQVIDAILTQKVSQARALQIRTVVNVLLPPTLPFPEEDLFPLLLNLLDNAIEASAKEAQGDISISIGPQKGFFSIDIRNRCSTDVFKENRSLQTSKANQSCHGIGLKIVRQIVEKHSGIFETYLENGAFVACALFPLSVPSSRPS